MPAYLNGEEGGWSSLFCAPVIFCFHPGYLLLLMHVSSSIVDMEVHAPGQILLASYTRGR